jgi:hypothetical protein
MGSRARKSPLPPQFTPPLTVSPFFAQITTFGGSPSQVTIWGESAGAGSVLQHTITNGGKTNPPLFERAMTSSTFLPPQYPLDGDIPNVGHCAVFQCQPLLRDLTWTLIISLL